MSSRLSLSVCLSLSLSLSPSQTRSGSQMFSKVKPLDSSQVVPRLLSLTQNKLERKHWRLQWHSRLPSLRPKASKTTWLEGQTFFKVTAVTKRTKHKNPDNSNNKKVSKKVSKMGKEEARKRIRARPFGFLLLEGFCRLVECVPCAVQLTRPNSLLLLKLLLLLNQIWLAFFPYTFQLLLLFQKREKEEK